MKILFIASLFIFGLGACSSAKKCTKASCKTERAAKKKCTKDSCKTKKEAKKKCTKDSCKLKKKS